MQSLNKRLNFIKLKNCYIQINVKIGAGRSYACGGAAAAAADRYWSHGGAPRTPGGNNACVKASEYCKCKHDIKETAMAAAPERRIVRIAAH